MEEPKRVGPNDQGIDPKAFVIDPGYPVHEIDFDGADILRLAVQISQVLYSIPEIHRLRVVELAVKLADLEIPLTLTPERSLHV